MKILFTVKWWYKYNFALSFQIDRTAHTRFRHSQKGEAAEFRWMVYGHERHQDQIYYNIVQWWTLANYGSWILAISMVITTLGYNMLLNCIHFNIQMVIFIRDKLSWTIIFTYMSAKVDWPQMSQNIWYNGRWEIGRYNIANGHKVTNSYWYLQSSHSSHKLLECVCGVQQSIYLYFSLEMCIVLEYDQPEFSNPHYKCYTILCKLLHKSHSSELTHHMQDWRCKVFITVITYWFTAHYSKDKLLWYYVWTSRHKKM